MRSSEKPTWVVTGIAFIAILAMGIYTTITDGGNYHLFFKGKGGMEGNLNGVGLIAVAFIFLFIMLWAVWSDYRQNKKRGH